MKDYCCDICEWKGDEPDIEEIQIEDSMVDVLFCPNCKTRINNLAVW